MDVVGAGRGGWGGARPEAHHVVQEGAGREKDLVAGLVVEAPAAQVGREVEVRGRGSRVLPRRGELLELPDRKRAPTRRGVEGGLSLQERHLVRLSLSRSRAEQGDQLGDCPRDSPQDSHLSFQTSELPLRRKRQKRLAEIGCGAERVKMMTPRGGDDSGTKELN